MNKQGFRRVAVFASTAALAGGAVAGCGGSSSASTTSNGTNQQNGQRGPGGGMDFTALAKELGVTTAKLQAAMQANRNQSPPTQQPGANGANDMAKNLAKALGLSETKVAAALKKVMPNRGTPPNGGTPPQGGNGQAPPSGTPAATATTTS